MFLKEGWRDGVDLFNRIRAWFVKDYWKFHCKINYQKSFSADNSNLIFIIYLLEYDGEEFHQKHLQVILNLIIQKDV